MIDHAGRDRIEALEAEVERLNAHVESLVKIGYEANKEWPERCALLAAEAAELRASLADAVGKIAAMESVVEAVRCGRTIGYDTGRLDRAFDAYEASLPGIVKVMP